MRSGELSQSCCCHPGQMIPWLGAGWQMGRREKMLGASHCSARREWKETCVLMDDSNTFELHQRVTGIRKKSGGEGVGTWGWPDSLAMEVLATKPDDLSSIPRSTCSVVSRCHLSEAGSLLPSCAG